MMKIRLKIEIAFNQEENLKSNRLELENWERLRSIWALSGKIEGKIVLDYYHFKGVIIEQTVCPENSHLLIDNVTHWKIE
jgi:hypothetical protein